MLLIRILFWLLLILILLPPLLMLIPFRYRVSGKADSKEKNVHATCSWLFDLLRFEIHQQAGKTMEAVMHLFGLRIDLTKKKRAANQQSADHPHENDQHMKEIKSEQQNDSVTAAPVSKKNEFSSNGSETRKKRSKKHSHSESFWKMRSQLPFKLSEVLTGDLFVELRRFLGRLWKALRPDVFVMNVNYGLPDPYHTALINNWMMALSPIFPTKYLRLHPVFHEELFDASGRIRGSLIPIAFVGAALRLLLAKPVRRIWWPLAKYTVKEKRRERKRRKNDGIEFK
jgi:hypothetical protein